MAGGDGPYDLDRFVEAQAESYERALAEIRGGRKRTHWMWYVFPQLAGLGMSEMSRRYAISGVDEARAYLAHPILGPRLVACVEAALAITDRSAHDVFGSPDDLKLRSCATLFAAASAPGSVFDRVLTKFWDGERDPATVRLLAAHPQSP